MVHFELPRSHEGYLDVLAKSLEAREFISNRELEARSEVLKGEEVWRGRFST